ncbi:MAG: UDP-N-acetylmuramoyl-L-alanyl-D-glutamate--2,6-diaminopimelate ligase [Burkholderiaceae bacterium]|nr:UDP-N-acetylmuramoyl-L-alanyl-D-glutamate--2,6-diaminopimelate ligase [Burkholderiaceae bacterium]
MRLTAAQVIAKMNWLRKIAPNAQLSADSRTIAAGDVFIAYPVPGADGRKHIEHAIAQGAVAVWYDPDGFDWPAAWALPHLAVARLGSVAGQLANAFYGQPDCAMFTVAVTGTNGKTSCTQWLGSALSRLGEPTAVIGTLGVGLYKNGAPDSFQVTGYTTPDAVQLQRHLANLRDVGATALAIEASSIGLHQARLDGTHFDVALFTNFTRDHLDYHGDEAAYEAAKTALFNWPGLQHAVINLDDDMGMRLVKHLRRVAPTVSIIGYTVQGKSADGVAVISASDIRSTQSGTAFHLVSPFGSCLLKTQMVGLFNVSNVLGVIGALLAKRFAWRPMIEAVEALTAVPGRMQRVGGPDAPLVVIDYAHTPDALEKTLATLRQVAQQRGGELWCVFGCGGDRDPGKRPQMGAIALAADHVVVTSDNPRGEEPAAIIAQIVAGMGAAKQPPQVFEDRAGAILWAVKRAAKTDVVLLAGKGHEAYQEIKGRKLPFLDADHAALALAARVTMKGNG